MEETEQRDNSNTVYCTVYYYYCTGYTYIYT